MTPTTSEREAQLPPTANNDAERAFDLGWLLAAKWAERDDLHCDMDSPAYQRDRAAALEFVTGAALTREQRVGERRSTHRVFRELSSVTESLPCYCEATSDHLVGREHPQQEAQGAVAQKNPFFMQIEAFNAWHDETYPSPCDAEQRGLWQGRRSQRYAAWNAAIAWFKTTPPAPVDVRVDQRDRWHLASLNDGLFIINEKPSPSGTDIPPDWGTMHPSVVLNVTELPATKAQEIVEAHNALLDGQPAGVECKWVGAMRGDGKCPQCSQYHALGGGGGRS